MQTAVFVNRLREKFFSGGQNPAAADVLSRIRQTCKFSGASSARTYMPIGPFFFVVGIFALCRRPLRCFVCHLSAVFCVALQVAAGWT